MLNAAERRIAELEAAILRHRHDVWGAACLRVEHEHDAKLYSVLGARLDAPGPAD